MTTLPRMSGGPTVLDLFSGIGGLALGFARAGFQHVEFCENDPWRRGILRRHWPDVPISFDVEVWQPSTGLQPDVVAGGPPCQSTSRAAAIHGRRTGQSLWPAMLSVVARCDPFMVVVEQPPPPPGWRANVTRDLEDLGYSVSWHRLSAGRLGAPHRRERLWALAHRDPARLAIAGRSLASAPEPQPWPAPAGDLGDPDPPRTRRVDDGLFARLDGSLRRRRIEALGDAVVPAMAERVALACREALA